MSATTPATDPWASIRAMLSEWREGVVPPAASIEAAHLYTFSLEEAGKSPPDSVTQSGQDIEMRWRVCEGVERVVSIDAIGKFAAWLDVKP